MTLVILPSLDDDEYDSDEYPELKPDLTALSDLIYTGTRRRIKSCQKATRGRYHEIYILDTTDVQKLVARLCRLPREPAVLRSEVATMTLVRSRTSVPVPAVHLFEDSPSNDVGMQFIVMDHIEGVHLYRIWDDLTLQHKKDVVSQMAWVLGLLSSMEFDTIGSIIEDGSVGPLLHRILDEVHGQDMVKDMSDGPFGSTSDYLSLFLNHFSSNSAISEENRARSPEIQTILENYFTSHGDELYIRPPFRLRHADFDGQNLLFARSDNASSPCLVGVIDWDYSHTAPLYFLYEYPTFIQDISSSEHLYEENAVLRQHFVRALRGQFSPGSTRYNEVRACIPSGKCSTLNGFMDIFMTGFTWSNRILQGLIGDYVITEGQGIGKAYEGREDWAPDPDDESESDECGKAYESIISSLPRLRVDR